MAVRADWLLVVEWIVAAPLALWLVLVLMLMPTRFAEVKMGMGWINRVGWLLGLGGFIALLVIFWDDLETNLSIPEIIGVLSVVIMILVAWVKACTDFNIWSPPRGFSLKGKTVLVTGGNAGIGFAASSQFARHGATVVLGCRNMTKGNAAAAKINASVKKSGLLAPVSVMQIDISKLDSVRSFAAAFRAKYQRLDILVNNAGLFVMSTGKRTEEGLELAFGAMHVGHFLLTNLLMPLLQATGTAETPARIINTSSEGHTVGSFHPSLFEGDGEGDLRGEHIDGRLPSYGRAKLANVLHVMELTRRWKQAGVTNMVAHSLHPGGVDTDIWPWRRWIPPFKQYFSAASTLVMRHATAAGILILAMATGEASGKESGWYCNCFYRHSDPAPLARDEKLAARLWQVSERLTATAAAPASAAPTSDE